MNSKPLSLSFSMFDWTILLSHIFVFMEGTKRTGTVVAMIMVVRKSSPMPFATLPIIFAVAGTMTIWSAMSARDTWPIFSSREKLEKLVCHLISRDRLEGQGRNEFHGVLGHDHVDARPFLGQMSHQLRLFYRRRSRLICLQ